MTKTNISSDFLEEANRRWKINGGSMQITFYKLSIDFYPFHPAGKLRYRFMIHTHTLHNYWNLMKWLYTAKSGQGVCVTAVRIQSYISILYYIHTWKNVFCHSCLLIVKFIFSLLFCFKIKYFVDNDFIFRVKEMQILAVKLTQK